MAIIVKEAYICRHCYSPYVECHKYVRTEGLDFSGEFMIDEGSIDDYEYCHACYGETHTAEAILIYIVNRQLLLEIVPDYVDKVIDIYLIPHEVYGDSACFVDERPKYLTQLDLNEFTQSIIRAITDESVSEQDKLDLLNTIIDMQS